MKDDRKFGVRESEPYPLKSVLFPDPYPLKSVVFRLGYPSKSVVHLLSPVKSNICNATGFGVRGIPWLSFN